MEFKRSGRNIFGVKLNSREQDTLNAEIKKSIGNWVRKHEVEEIAIVLYQLSKQCDFDPEQLKNFYENYYPELRRLTKYYEMDDKETPWLCTEMLKREGIDVEAWYNESIKNEKEFDNHD